MIPVIVGKATRAKVQGVIDELSYKPNAQARGLAARRSYLLGMIYDNRMRSTSTRCSVAS